MISNRNNDINMGKKKGISSAPNVKTIKQSYLNRLIGIGFQTSKLFLPISNFIKWKPTKPNNELNRGF